MADVYNANAIFLIGNDVTNQNPLVAWQIRTAVRHHNAKLYVINGRPSKIHRQAAVAVQVPEGGEAQAIRWLASEHGQFDPKTTRISSS
jgi:NADH-quinone oxidoreductase subunit G